VYLAYAGGDEERARALAAALRALGVDVCFAADTLRPGDNWHSLLPDWIKGSTTVVALLSAASSDAYYLQSELVLAVEAVREQGRRLAPVRLAPDAWVPFGTQQLHAVDMFTDADVAVVAAHLAQLGPAAATVKAGGVFSHRVPAAPRFLTGRDDLVRSLVETLRAQRSVVVTQAIRGLGGVGKTTVAVALAEALGPEVDLVWWVRAETPTLLVADLAELAPHVGAPRLDDPAGTAAQVRQRLETTERTWLVVFDNVPDQRSIERALPLFEANLGDRKRVLGADHPDTLVTQHNLATAYREAGNLDRAIPLLEMTLGARERSLGIDHPQTLNSRHGLAGLYEEAGELDRASELYESALRGAERVMGPDHPDTRRCRGSYRAALAELARPGATSDDP
jgi:adenylate kinase family enzyme